MTANGDDRGVGRTLATRGPNLYPENAMGNIGGRLAVLLAVLTFLAALLPLETALLALLH
jgi:hypothetical protein